MKILGGKSAEPNWLCAVAGALMLGGPVWHYLYVNHYPFGRAEAIVLPGAAALIGAALAVLGHRVGGWLESLCFGSLLYVFQDLQLDLHDRTYAIAILGSCIALAAVFRRRRAALTSIMLGTFYLASLPRSAAIPVPRSLANAQGSPELPVLVHVILDEQWGIGGLRAEGDTGTATFLSDFYRKRGFEVYEAAYSRYRQTRESIPAALSLGHPLRFNEKSIAPAYNRSLQAIPYFEDLRRRGYAIHVYQSTYLDFCHVAGVPVASCETRPGNSIANIGLLHGDWTKRAVLAGRYFLIVTSHLYQRLHPGGSPESRSSNAGGGLNVLEQVRDAIIRRPTGGTMFFVHALLPHRPVQLDAKCDAVSDPSLRDAAFKRIQRSDSSWQAELINLGGQIRCTHRVIAEILDALDSTVSREGSIVIIHGDHGSRMHQDIPKDVLSEMSLRDLNGRFSTLLAVRRPGVPPTIQSEPVPVQDFLWELARNDFKGVVRQPWRHFVRDRARDSIGTELERSLAEAEMLWVRAPTRALADSSPQHY